MGVGPATRTATRDYERQRGRPRRILRFLMFLVILAVAVLLLMATVARPILRMVVVPWAEDNPSALRIGFVADLVREDLGTSLIERRPRDGSDGGGVHR